MLPAAQRKREAGTDAVGSPGGNLELLTDQDADGRGWKRSTETSERCHVVAGLQLSKLSPVKAQRLAATKTEFVAIQKAAWNAHLYSFSTRTSFCGTLVL